MAIFNGNNSSNNITSNADIIDAKGGNDTVTATNTSFATVFGGDGNDTLIYAGSASGGQSLMFGGSGADLLRGGMFKDILDGGSGNDTLEGLGGDDLLEGSTGADVINGGDGSDTATYILACKAVKADLATPGVNTGDAAGDTYFSVENLAGSIFNDTLAGNSGDNILEGGYGRDTLIGREGIDYASYVLSFCGVRADLLTPASNTGPAAGDSYSGIEGLIGSCFNDTLSGDNGANTLEGGKGADQLNGRLGQDFASYTFACDGVVADLGTPALNTGDAKGDTYSGIEGLIGSAFADTLGGTAGVEVLRGGGGDDFLRGGPGGDVLDGGAGFDTAVYSDATAAVRADISNTATNQGDAAGDTYISIDNLVGSAFNDILKGDNNENRIEGRDGNDTVVGVGDADTLIGGLGNDSIQGNGGNDTVEGSQGDDTMSGGVPGRDYFVFHEYGPGAADSWGSDRILDFEDGVDLLDFRNSGAYGGSAITFADLTISQEGADVLILGPHYGESILLLNRSAAIITSSDFLF
jgi:serralysin